MSQLHALYRFYGADGTLLYVGITKDPGRRFIQHGSSKDWWRNVASIQIEYLDSRDDLASAEREAIRSELPRHNICGMGRQRGSQRTVAGVLDPTLYKDCCERCQSLTTPLRHVEESRHGCGRRWVYACDCGYKWTCYYADVYYEHFC